MIIAFLQKPFIKFDELLLLTMSQF